VINLRRRPHVADDFQITSKGPTMVYLQINLSIAAHNRAAAALVYTQYKRKFLTGIDGALSKELLIREEDVQVLHGFDSTKNAKAYLGSALFKQDVVGALAPLLQNAPDVRIYQGSEAP
jgi:hypothetical protein